MAILNNEATIIYAKDLTAIAIEHHMITASDNATETAENIYECYKTLYEKFSGKKVD